MIFTVECLQFGQCFLLFLKCIATLVMSSRKPLHSWKACSRSTGETKSFILGAQDVNLMVQDVIFVALHVLNELELMQSSEATRHQLNFSPQPGLGLLVGPIEQIHCLTPKTFSMYTVHCECKVGLIKVGKKYLIVCPCCQAKTNSSKFFPKSKQDTFANQMMKHHHTNM